MECAIYFIVAKKMRTLRNLAATDKTTTGKKFFNFVTSTDFSSERGRGAAEKNAFSLLRKCRYRVASAFFLLSEPPALKSALETILTKLHDVDLAFMVARLMESDELGQNGGSNAGGYGLGGFGGGGGGYAATGSCQQETTDRSADTEIDEWKPRLGREGKNLLIERCLPTVGDDHSLAAVQLLWLGKKEEACWLLSGSLELEFGDKKKITCRPARDTTHRFFPRSKGAGSSTVKVTIDRTNSVIDLAAKSNLLRKLGASPRAYFASGFLVAKTLAVRGVEVASLRVLLLDSGEGRDGSREVEGSNGPDDFVKGEPLANRTEAAPASSSIFADYEPPPSPPQQNSRMMSSIFDGFDVAPPKPKFAIPPSNDMQSSIFDSFDVPAAAAAKPKAQLASSGAMQSSIFDDFDVPVQKKPSQPAQSSIFADYDMPPAAQLQTPTNGPTEQVSLPHINAVRSEEAKLDFQVERIETPRLWLEWKTEALTETAARRLLREVAGVLAEFHGDPLDLSIQGFYSHAGKLISPRVSEVLQQACDAERIKEKVRDALDNLCGEDGLDKDAVVHYAVRMLGPSSLNQRSLFVALLYLALGRGDKADDIVRVKARALIQCCTAFAFSVDDLVHRKKTRAHTSTQLIRRETARMSWQLESCLWLHRGGGLPLSGETLKEATVAVRIGLVLASWNNNFECLVAVMQTQPDCLTDEDAGRHLWTSLPLMSPGAKTATPKKTSSGGWEFLVDCRRSQATVMLREQPTGCFIIRPHAEDRRVFTLSFKTNLVPTRETGKESEDRTPDTSGDELTDGDPNRVRKARQARVRKDDVVQHAIIRLSDSGFRCGSFGPFTSLLHLLEAVSSSLPFQLPFDLPPSNRVIAEEGFQTSPNAVLLRKIALHGTVLGGSEDRRQTNDFEGGPIREAMSPHERKTGVGLFTELLVLSSLRRQLSGIASVEYEDGPIEGFHNAVGSSGSTDASDSSRSRKGRAGNLFASRVLRPLLLWCRAMEVCVVPSLAPELQHVPEMVCSGSVEVTESPEAIEVAPQHNDGLNGSATVLRRLIQHKSGVEFSTLRLVDGGECAMVLLFSRKDAVAWLVSNGLEHSEVEASPRLERMQRERIIESVDLSRLPVKQKGSNEEEGVRYRFVDPWEVEALSNRDGETRSASLGRNLFLSFSLGRVAVASSKILRSLGGLPLLELWTTAKGGVALTKAVASVYPPWERSAGRDLSMADGSFSGPPPFLNSIRQSLYRKMLFRRLQFPQRFLALVQVELLDLKNLTTPSGSLSLIVYALLRLKRAGSGATLTNKSRTLDSAATNPVKLGKSSGPNAPASWGSVVRFRFPLPEDVAVDCTSYDNDRESLFRGPPSVR